MSEAKKVLVIDDSPFILKAVKKALEPNGFTVIGYAENGKIGLEMYEKFMPDLVTLDVTMPIMDGLETATHLFRKHSKVKIVMLSAMGDEVLVGSAKNIGIKHFIPKPFKAAELLEVVNSMF